LEKGVAAMGWSLREISEQERKKIYSFFDYNQFAQNVYSSQYSSVKRLYEKVKENDIIWMRSKKDGKYYLGRVRSNSKWMFNNDAVEIDAANQLTNIKWYPATEKADESSVPGVVTTAFIKGSTFQKIHNPSIETYSQFVYNRAHKIEEDSFFYPESKLECNEFNFFSLLNSYDVEDLLALWLYKTKGYITIPSTNKISTPKYECVLIDPADKERKHIYIQAKKGKDTLDASEYKNLCGEVYLLTTEGVVSNNKYDNVKKVEPTVIFEFAINPDNYNIIPEHVLYWINFLNHS
jgi:hypothetical protein